MASIRDRLLASLGLRPKQRAAALGLPPAYATGFSRIIPGSDIDANPIGSKAEALTQYNGWVFAAASFIAEETRALEWDVWLRRGMREEWTIDSAHPINGILASPNAHMSWGDFIELSDLHFSVNGEAFWHVIRDEGDNPLGLEVIYPHWVQEPAIEGGRLVGWKVAKPGAAAKTIPAADVIRIHRPHPKAPFLAASIVEAAAVSHYFDLYLRAYGMTLFRNDGGVPAGLLSSDQELTPDQASAIREAWRQKYSRTRGEVAVLGSGSTYQPLAIPMQDLKLLEAGQFTREQVLGLFRVSPALLGLTGDSNRANLEAALWGFQRHTLRPRAMRYAEVVRSRVLPVFMTPQAARSYWFEFRDVVDQDSDRERATANDMLSKGAATINEYRERMGAARIEGGDVFLIPSGFTVTGSHAAAMDNGGSSEPARALLAPVEPVVMAARLTAARLQAENHDLRVELAQRRIYTDLRGFFARCYRDSKAAGLEHIALPDSELTERGIRDHPLLAPADGEGMVEHAERLKSDVAQTIARAMAERSTA